MLRIYGIPNCGSVKKAIAWAKASGLDFSFINFREEPPDSKLVAGWLAAVGADKLCNRRGLAWRGLTQEERREALSDESRLLALLLEKPLLIKRPVMAFDDGFVSVGVDEALWEAHR